MPAVNIPFPSPQYHGHNWCRYLGELALPYEPVMLDMRKGEHKQPAFLAVNPFGKVRCIKYACTHPGASCEQHGQQPAAPHLIVTVFGSLTMHLKHATLAPSALHDTAAVAETNHTQPINPFIVGCSVWICSIFSIPQFMLVMLRSVPYLQVPAMTDGDVNVSFCMRVLSIPSPLVGQIRLWPAQHACYRGSCISLLQACKRRAPDGDA